MRSIAYQHCPPGVTPYDALTGDVILCHRTDLASRLIRRGEAIRYRQGDRWSHMAFVVNEYVPSVIEALTGGVQRTALSAYHDTEYVLVRTSSEMSEEDRSQAYFFARSCMGQHYGWLDDVAIGLRFLTPGRGLWFGQDGTQMCSGLCCQALVRSWYNFSFNPASMSPAEAAIDLGVPATLGEAREEGLTAALQAATIRRGPRSESA